MAKTEGERRKSPMVARMAQLVLGWTGVLAVIAAVIAVMTVYIGNEVERAHDAAAGSPSRQAASNYP